MNICALYCIKNEIEFLPLSLATVLPYVDSVVIVNNRSTDGTVEFVNSLQDPKVQLFHMNTDFDEKCEYNVRNESLKFVSPFTDWILALDGDQLLSDNWRNQIEPALSGKYEAVGVRYEHHVGGYEHVDKGLYQKEYQGKSDPIWCFFRRRDGLQCRPASEVCSWARPWHHASFERSCNSAAKVTAVKLHHYGFAKKNMMEMSLYRIHRGDYGHEDCIKAEKSAELKADGNPFKFIGPVHPVDYGPKQQPTVMRPILKRYTLELDAEGRILKRTVTATGELAQ